MGAVLRIDALWSTSGGRRSLHVVHSTHTQSMYSHMLHTKDILVAETCMFSTISHNTLVYRCRRKEARRV